MANPETQTTSVWRITGNEAIERDDPVVTEFTLTVILNGKEVVTLLCSPTKLDYLALGFLASEGFITSKDDVKAIRVDERSGTIMVETQSATVVPGKSNPRKAITSSKGATFYSGDDLAGQMRITSETGITASAVFNLMRQFQQRSGVFKSTGGSHSAALSDGQDILIFAEDIGRHNAIDKVLGEALWEAVPTRDRILFTSGRMPREIVFKIAKRGIPMIISKSAPTDGAVRAAAEIGITLIGFARGDSMNVYAHRERVSM